MRYINVNADLDQRPNVLIKIDIYSIQNDETETAKLVAEKRKINDILIQDPTRYTIIYLSTHTFC